MMNSDEENAFQGIAPLSLSSESADYPSYHVFINHRGPDVKKTVAEAIYRHLSAFNLRVFLDQKELRIGDFLPAAIQHALATCNTHVAIFSPGYAQSPWCLAELTFMLKTRAKIIPVFYDVQPLHLRDIQSGPYAKAFEDYHRKNRIDLNIVEKWKQDLHRASFIAGRLVFDTRKDEEHILLKSIVDRVVEEAKGEVLEVAKHPVGLDEALQAFQKTMLESDEEQGSYEKVVGIVGMGGSGKTTLAKKIYNERSWAYKGRCCFLSDVRLESTKNGLASLQRKLLQKLVHYDWQIENTSQGKEFLRSNLQNREVLIVLDDVDDEEQIDALLVKEVLVAGSLVIVTSRYKSVLTSCGISLFHEVKGMAETHAKQLFCWHAFLLPYPEPGFESLVQSFLVACSGLPLSLKVIGSLLYKKKIDYWNGTLEKIGKHILPNNIIDTLKISYEALGREEREIFLDIAWFFSGAEKNMLVNIWDGSGWSSLQCLESLEQKCLVEFVHENRGYGGYDNEGQDCLLVRMHDHLRDMGKSVLDDQTPPTRLWRPLDIRDYLSRLQLGLIMDVRGICTSPAPNVYEGERMATPMSPWKACWMQVLEICGVSSMFRSCSVDVVGSALRLLAANGESVITEFSDLSKELLWLRWDGYTYTSIPPHFSMQKLRVLDIRSVLESLWQSDEQAPTQLRELSVHGLSKLPESIGLLKHLKKIVLSVGSMTSLPDELCHLKSLNHLDLHYCIGLKSLPSRFGNLTNLRHLDLTNCSNLQALPDSFSQLIQLQYLCLYDCHNLMLSTGILRNIQALQYLDLSSLTSESLPTLTCQSFLTNLYVSCPNLKNLPTDMGELRNLRVLQVQSPVLTSLPSSLQNLSFLKSLKLIGCVNLNCIPESIGQLKNLEHLRLHETKVEILPQGVACLINLVELSVTTTPLVEVMLSTLRSPHAMSRLKSINLSHSGIVNLSVSKEVCPSLESLKAPWCENLEEVKALPITLVNLDLQGCGRLKKIRGLSNLSKLRYLNMRECLELQELEELSQSASLELLIADGCCLLTKMDGLKHHSQLKDIQIAACQTGVWEGRKCLERLPSKASNITLNMKIVGGDEREVDSTLSSLRFPISVLEFSSKWVCKLGLEEVRSCSAIIMVLLCKSSENSHDPKREVLSLGNRFSVQQYQVTVRIESQCEWLIISLFTRDSAFIEDLKIIKVEDDMGVYAHAPFENTKGWVVFLREGEEWKITEIWERLFTYAYSKRPILRGIDCDVVCFTSTF